ncbi:hypothetical protein MAR_009423 [Mya arenaria]|uniref:Uncharacterized protein n=1 Tax=Mya arenaria TaxID=6604 RepID=A0ABY7DZC2_MYAAR|nr:uncharacterized protein LOC128231748 [Mya arenaria]WAR02865.1 hypothetical protein MAR_009423 [Mya arenaria]
MQSKSINAQGRRMVASSVLLSKRAAQHVEMGRRTAVQDLTVLLGIVLTVTAASAACAVKCEKAAYWTECGEFEENINMSKDQLHVTEACGNASTFYKCVRDVAPMCLEEAINTHVHLMAAPWSCFIPQTEYLEYQRIAQRACDPKGQHAQVNGKPTVYSEDGETKNRSVSLQHNGTRNSSERTHTRCGSVVALVLIITTFMVLQHC